MILIEASSKRILNVTMSSTTTETCARLAIDALENGENISK